MGYGGNFKRSGPPSNLLGKYEHLGAMAHKRGLRDRDDPRNLFRSVYGGIFRPEISKKFHQKPTQNNLFVTSIKLKLAGGFNPTYLRTYRNQFFNTTMVIVSIGEVSIISS